MSQISLLTANLAVVILESLFYGIYFILASYTLYVIVTRHRERVSSVPAGTHPRFLSPVALGTLALFVTVTAHWLLNVSRLFIAFDSEDGPGPENFFSNLSHVTEVLKCGFQVASVIIGESLIIHHLWVIWAFRPRIIVAPCVTLMVFTAFGVGLTYQLSSYGSNDSIFKAAFQKWHTGACFADFCTAAYTTIFIWYKLWNTSRVLKKLGVSSLSTIIRIFIDSAALIFVWGVFHTVSYQCGSNLQFIAIDCMSVVTGMSNLLIQIRLHWDLNNAGARDLL